MQTLNPEQYPIGVYDMPSEISQSTLQKWIKTLETFPAQLRDRVRDLNEKQLDTPYRDGGWTVRRVVHHLADSHHHSYIRFKWALTEDNPVIKPYDEKGWNDLPDLKDEPLEWSLKHLDVIHFKLVRLLKVMTDSDFDKTFVHPVGNKKITLRQNVGQYAWHSLHHFAHIENALKR